MTTSTMKGTAAFVLGLTLAGCLGGTAPSVGTPSEYASIAPPSASPELRSSDQASQPASPNPSEGSSVLGADAIAQVVTSDLVVRSLPEISDASEIHEVLLNEPTLLYIVGGPVGADGYEWYQVQPFGMHYLDFMRGAPPFGWVAAGDRDREAWIAPTTLDCPDATIDAIRAMPDVARLACFGGDELTLDGQFAGCFIADPTIVTPEWLLQSGCGLAPIGYRAGEVLPDPGALPMRFQGDVGMPSDSPNATVRVTGHLDDPAAAGCRPVAFGSDEAGDVETLELAEAVLRCRAQFVVTSVTVLEDAPS